MRQSQAVRLPVVSNPAESAKNEPHATGTAVSRK